MGAFLLSSIFIVIASVYGKADGRNRSTNWPICLLSLGLMLTLKHLLLFCFRLIDACFD